MQIVTPVPLLLAMPIGKSTEGVRLARSAVLKSTIRTRDYTSLLFANRRRHGQHVQQSTASCIGKSDSKASYEML
jgi:hypothetical protein